MWCLAFQIKLPSSIPPAKQSRKVYQYHKANINRILEEMNQFSSIFLSQDPHQYPVERNWQQLKHTLLTMVEAHIPHKIISLYKDLPWMNKSIKTQMKKRKRLYNKAKHSQSPSDWNQYKIARNAINKSLKQAHEQYCQHLFDDSFANN